MHSDAASVAPSGSLPLCEGEGFDLPHARHSRRILMHCIATATKCLLPTARRSLHPSPMPVRSDTLPRASSLWTLHQPGDFLDCYSVPSTLSPAEAARRGLALPAWAGALLAVRNALVRPFGLKTDAGEGSIFPTSHESEDEIVLGFDDRHLDFRIGLIRAEGRIYMSTWVHPHNLWGRAYLRLVMPFHILISRGAVERMATER